MAISDARRDEFDRLFGEQGIAGKPTLHDLLELGREIWGEKYRQTLSEIVPRLMVGVGDLARLLRDGPAFPDSSEYKHQVKKELGNLIFSTIRWCSDLGFTPGECVRAAAEAQEEFAKSGRPR